MGRRFSRILYAESIGTLDAEVKTKFVAFRTEGYPDLVNQPDRLNFTKGSVFPFSKSTFTEKFATTITKRALSNSAATGMTEDTLNFTKGIEDGSVPVRKLKGFKPAKVIVFVPDGGTNPTATKTSKITGIIYDRRLGKSYTYSFGAADAVGQKGQLEMQGYLYNKAVEGTSLSFKPEDPS